MTGLAPRFRLPPGVDGAAAPIRSERTLVEYFAAGCKDEGGRLLGVEYERVPLLEDGRAAPHEAPGPSVTGLLRSLADSGAWEPVEIEGHLLGLCGPSGDVHLEPGGQPELAILPHVTAHDVVAPLEDWAGSLRTASERTGVFVAAIGLQPVTPVPEIGWVPKERYRIMSAHLGARGAHAHHMMKASAGLQLNLDYVSEEDACDLLRTAFAVSPLVNATCVNSPLENGRPSGFLSKRPHVWLDTDPDRCGLLPWVYDECTGFERYVRYALGVPVMFVVRKDRWHALGDVTFKEFLSSPGPLGPATLDDWHLHLTTLFPEVRLKQHVEVRGMDSCSVELAAGLTALWRGLLYDVAARRGAFDLVADLDAEDRLSLHRDVGLRGLDARLQDGRTVRALAATMLELAADGLARLHEGAGDADLLSPLAAIVAGDRPSPAQELLADVAARGPAACRERV